jgi:sigma-B regulation protein RsbU (phosphoserine phosphatase)
MVPGVFTEDDLDMLKTVASNAAVAIENARLYQVAVDKGKMEQELQVAKKVQSGLIPQTTPEIEGWEFASHWEPAKEVAGDFFDFIEKKDGKIGLMIADVVDKGIAAALYMAFSRSTLRASLTGSEFPNEGISKANQLICNDTAYGMFLTLAYLEIDPGNFEIRIVNGGHNPPLVYQKSKKGLTPIPRTGMLVGVDDQAKYEETIVKLEVGDFIVLFTDGVTEAINQKDEEFGNERLEKIIMSNKKASAQELMDVILSKLTAFTENTPQFDDITLLIAKHI